MPPVKFAHVVFKTRKFDEMIEWYTHALECRTIFKDDKFAFLAYDDEHHRIAFLNLDTSTDTPGDKDEKQTPLSLDRIGVFHVAYSWASLPDLLDEYSKLKARGVLPLVSIRHGPTVSFYYADPDGNALEFQVDVGTVEDATAFMHSPAFKKNPRGERFDPEEVIRDLAAGVPLERLVLRSDQPLPQGGVHPS